MSWNQFDGSMQGAGGFMDTTIGEGAANADGEKGPKRGQNCVPVIIAQLQRHGEQLAVWGTPAKIVTFIALIRKLEIMSTKVTFEFQDDSGSIKGIKWLEGDNMDYVSPVKVDTYARVFGLVRDQNNEHSVLIVNVQPIDNLNELLVHLMEVTYMCLQGEKIVNGITKVDSSVLNHSNTDREMNDGANNSGLSHHHKIVLNIIQNSDPEYGAERDTIKAKVPEYMIAKVDEIIEFLITEGHIYTTKTDDFFKAI